MSRGHITAAEVSALSEAMGDGDSLEGALREMGFDVEESLPTVSDARMAEIVALTLRNPAIVETINRNNALLRHLTQKRRESLDTPPKTS